MVIRTGQKRIKIIKIILKIELSLCWIYSLNIDAIFIFLRYCLSTLGGCVICLILYQHYLSTFLVSVYPSVYMPTLKKIRKVNYAIQDLSNSITKRYNKKKLHNA